MTDNLPPLPSPKIHACRCGVVHADFDGESMEDYARAALAQAQSLPAGPTNSIELEEYSAGLLNDFGGGNVEWWWDYIRHELGAAYAHYQDQLTASPQPQPVQQDHSEQHLDMVAQAPNAQQAEAQKPLFWYRPCGDGLYEGPHHNNSVGGRMMREEQPDAWKPLFTRPQPAQLQALSDEEARKAVADEGLGFAGSDVRLAKAIQSALAAKNGANLK